MKYQYLKKQPVKIDLIDAYTIVVKANECNDTKTSNEIMNIIFDTIKTNKLKNKTTDEIEISQFIIEKYHY